VNGSTFGVGEVLEGSFEIINNGEAIEGHGNSAIVRAVLSLDPAIGNADDILLGEIEIDIPELEMEAPYLAEFRYQLGDNLEKGDYFLILELIGSSGFIDGSLINNTLATNKASIFVPEWELKIDYKGLTTASEAKTTDSFIHKTPVLVAPALDSSNRFYRWEGNAPPGIDLLDFDIEYDLYLRAIYVPIEGAPEIVIQPHDQQIKRGGRAIFRVTAGGSLPLTFQWFKDGTLMENQNGDSLILTETTQGDAGWYQVEVSNSEGTIESQEVELFFISEGSIRSFLDPREDFGGSWYLSNWFGLVKSDDYPWLYHQILGWIYIESPERNSFRFWSRRFGWIWTDSKTYPYVWSYEKSDWLFVYPHFLHEKRWVYDFSRGDWLELFD
jgi:hypothetical protein